MTCLRPRCPVPSGYPPHALAMLKNAREGIEPDQPGSVGPIKQIEALQQKVSAGLSVT